MGLIGTVGSVEDPAQAGNEMTIPIIITSDKKTFWFISDFSLFKLIIDPNFNQSLPSVNDP
jgi:hypothetical protein